MSNPIAQQTAKHLNDVHFGGNWTVSNVEEKLSNLSWEQVLIKHEDLNSIATLTFHMSYFINVAYNFYKTGKVIGNDKESFDHPPINSQADWVELKSHYLNQVKELVQMVKKLPDEKLLEPFGEEKYGNHFRNIHGIIEHTHYHLGQISLIKKLIA